jgi:two-component system sensor histidine kinase UhpB
LACFNDDTQLNIYRVVQEALTNISKHAGEQALSVQIDIEQKKNSLLITIQDNGQGCDLKLPHNGFGLKGMLERVEYCAGTLLCTSQPGTGMTVRVRLPFPLKEIA